MPTFMTILPGARLRIGWRRASGSGGLSAAMDAADLEDYRRTVIAGDPLGFEREELFLADGREVCAVLREVDGQTFRLSRDVIDLCAGGLAAGEPVTVELYDPLLEQ